ncbi:MAG: secretin N-terminal domain-containing protein [Phycisphaerales bacterium]
MRVAGAEPAATFERARQLYAAQIAPAIAGGPGDAPDPKTEVSATFEPATRSAVLVGEPAALAKFATVLEQLTAAAGPQPDVRLIPLEHAKAMEVAALLGNLPEGPLGAVVEAAAPGAPRPVVEAIERTNTLLVAAQPAQHQAIATLVRTLDVPEQANLPPLRIFQLRTADAANLAATLQQTYAKRTSEERSARPVSVSADPQTNALLVAAHPDLLPDIERIVEELNDVNRMVTEGRAIRIFPLKVARAAELAKTIDEMFPPPPVPVDPRGRPRPELQKPREVIVRADPQTNALIVDAPVQRMTGFEELVRSLDQQEIGTDNEIRTWRLSRADVTAAADTLRQLAAAGSLGTLAPNRRAAITVTVEPGTRTLVVAGPSEIFPRVDDFLKGLDAERTAPATALRFFKLNVARAETVAPMLREILAGRIAEEVAGTPAELQALLRVTADKKSNVLIISAPEAVMPAAEALVKQLDSTASAGGDAVIRVRPLTFADARDVSQSLSQALPSMTSKVTGDPLAVRITASASANALILVGPEADLKEVESLIEPLDARPALDAVDARSFVLRFADAARIAPIVQNLLADQQETDPRIVLERLRRSRGQVDTTPRVRVEADARTNRLIVSGPQRTVALAETLIGELDQADAAGDRTMATFTPANADPATLAATARQVVESTRPAGQRSTLQLIPAAQSGALLLVGAESEIAEAVAVMKEIDGQSLAAPAMDLRVLALRNGDARTVAPAVASLLQDRTRWPERLRQVAKAGIAIGQPTATADGAGNRLLVSGPTELMPLAEKLVAELDRPRAQGDVLDVRTFSLGTADAKGVAEAIRTALEARAASRPGEPKPFVAAEPSSNAVVVTATPEQLGQIEQLVGTLDAGTPRDQAQVRTIFLKNGRAAQIAPLVESLLAEQELVDPKSLPSWAQAEYARVRAQLRGGKPEVRVRADERLNAVVVAAPGAVLDAAEQMVSQLDVAAQDPTERRSVRLLALRNADAAEVATALEPIFADDKDREKPPTIRVNAASNALLVRASEGQFATIERVVGEIDQATMATSRQMRTIPLDAGKASARDVAEMLKRLLGGDSGGAAGGAPTVEVITLDELLEREKSRTPAAAGAAAPKKTSSLPHADEGRSVASLLACMILAADPADATDSTNPTKATRPGPADASKVGAADATIAVDERTNSLVIVGSPRTVERLAALAKQAQDQVPTAPVSLHVITLDAANDPERLRTLLGEMLEKISPPGGKPGELGKRVALLSDPALNAIVVAASDSDFKVVSQMLAAVGRAPVGGDAPVRTITLERAQATGVAQAVQRFYDERAKMTPNPRGQRDRKRLVIVGDPTSNTLLVAANDDDFLAQVQRDRRAVRLAPGGERAGDASSRSSTPAPPRSSARSSSS